MKKTLPSKIASGRPLFRRVCEQAATLVSLDNLLSLPLIREPVDQNTPALHGWHFDIDAVQLVRIWRKPVASVRWFPGRLPI